MPQSDTRPTIDHGGQPDLRSTSDGLPGLMLRFRVLGPPIMEGPDGALGGAAAQRKALALLALLAVAGERGMSRDKILAYLWPETPEDRAAHRLTQLLYSLRQDLRTPLFLRSTDLRLNPLAVSTDVADFHAALAADQPDLAVSMYGGPFLDGFFLEDAGEFDQWAEGERANLLRKFTSSLEVLATQAEAESDPVAAAHWWGRLVQVDPLNARVTVRYMETLTLSGNRAGALKFARTYEARLREEFGASPERVVSAAVERLRGQAAEETSVAVLPFINMSGERENEYFSDGMAEELTNALAHVSGLRVASRTSAFAFRGKNLDVREIGARLGVTTLVEGSVRKADNELRVTAQLVDACSGYHLWSGTYQRTVADVFSVQEELSQAIVRALPLKLGSVPEPLVIPRPTVVLEAYTLYLRGRHFALKRTIDSLRLAIDYFEQAIELDQEYALAYAGIGECYTLLGFEEFGDLPPREAMPRAKAAVERALELDPQMAEGYAWQAVLAFLYDYDWKAAEASFKRAIELKPTYSLAHTWYAVFLSAMARHEEALARIHHAEQLDPLAVIIQGVMGHIYYYASQFDEALRRYLTVLEMDPANLRVHSWLARLELVTRQLDRGRKRLEATMQRLGRPPILLVQLGCFFAELGRKEEARAIIEELERLGEHQHVSVVYTGFIYRALREPERLIQAYDEGIRQCSAYVPFLGVEPAWNYLRQEPSFQALIDRLGFHAQSPANHGALATL